MTAPTELDVSIRALIEEGLDILVNLIDNITKHGNYSPESTCTFIDQAGQAFREALRSLPASGAGWRPISEAPKDGTNVLYRNQFRDIGFCHWDEGYDEDDQPCWWDNEADQEVCPVIWLPADTLPAFPTAPDRRAGE